RQTRVADGDALVHLRHVDLPQLGVHLRRSRVAELLGVDAQRGPMPQREAAEHLSYRTTVELVDGTSQPLAEARERDAVADALPGHERERSEDVRGRAGARVEVDGERRLPARAPGGAARAE